MREPRHAIGSIPPTTISYPEEIDRELEEQLRRLVHDSPYNFRDNLEGDKTLNPARRGLPRHEW